MKTVRTILFLATTGLFGETLVLTTGERLDGRLTTVSLGEFTFEVAGSPVKISRAKIASILLHGPSPTSTGPASALSLVDAAVESLRDLDAVTSTGTTLADLRQRIASMAATVERALRQVSPVDLSHPRIKQIKSARDRYADIDILGPGLRSQMLRIASNEVKNIDDTPAFASGETPTPTVPATTNGEQAAASNYR